MGARSRKVPAAPLSLTGWRKLARRWEKKCDKALSQYVRAKTLREFGGCPFCGGEIHHCFHFVTRKRRVIRWLLLNVIGTCKSCNKQERYWPDLSRAWFVKHYGAEVYIDLVRRSRRDWKAPRDMDRTEVERFVRYLQTVAQHYTLKLQELVRKD